MTSFEAMLKGCHESRPLEGDFFKETPDGPSACALGAMLLGNLGIHQMRDLALRSNELSGPLHFITVARSMFPILGDGLPYHFSKCPGCKDAVSVSGLAIHLVDYHHIPRLKIGKWLDRLERRKERLDALQNAQNGPGKPCTLDNEQEAAGATNRVLGHS